MIEKIKLAYKRSWQLFREDQDMTLLGKIVFVPIHFVVMPIVLILLVKKDRI